MNDDRVTRNDVTYTEWLAMRPNEKRRFSLACLIDAIDNMHNGKHVFSLRVQEALKRAREAL